MSSIKLDSDLLDSNLPPGWGVNAETLDLWQTEKVFISGTDSYKLNGEPTLVPMPEEFSTVQNFSEMYPDKNLREPSEVHRIFKEFCGKYNLYTLAYSYQTAASVQYLSTEFPWTLLMIAEEIAPCKSNKRLTKRHGRYTVYRAGCSGPLCRASNTRMIGESRARAAERPYTPSVILQHIENIRDSYWAYFSYAEYLTEWRAATMVPTRGALARVQERESNADPYERMRNQYLRSVLRGPRSEALATTIMLDVTPENLHSVVKSS